MEPPTSLHTVTLTFTDGMYVGEGNDIHHKASQQSLSLSLILPSYNTVTKKNKLQTTEATSGNTLLSHEK